MLPLFNYKTSQIAVISFFFRKYLAELRGAVLNTDYSVWIFVVDNCVFPYCLKPQGL